MILLVFVIILLTVIYWYIKNHYSRWENEGKFEHFSLYSNQKLYNILVLLGFPHLKATIPFGNLKSVVKSERSFGTAIYDLYR